MQKLFNECLKLVEELRINTLLIAEQKYAEIEELESISHKCRTLRKRIETILDEIKHIKNPFSLKDSNDSMRIFYKNLQEKLMEVEKATTGAIEILKENMEKIDSEIKLLRQKNVALKSYHKAQFMK